MSDEKKTTVEPKVSIEETLLATFSEPRDQADITSLEGSRSVYSGLAFTNQTETKDTVQDQLIKNVQRTVRERTKVSTGGWIDVMDEPEVEYKEVTPQGIVTQGIELQKLLSTYRESLTIQPLADVTYSLLGETSSRTSALIASASRNRNLLAKVDRKLYDAARKVLKKESLFVQKALINLPSLDKIAETFFEALATYTPDMILDYIVVYGHTVYATREDNLQLCQPSVLIPKLSPAPIKTPTIVHTKDNILSNWSFSSFNDYSFSPTWLTTNVTLEFVNAVAHTLRIISAHRPRKTGETPVNVITRLGEVENKLSEYGKVQAQKLDLMEAQVQNLVRLAASLRLGTGEPINSVYRLLIGAAVHALPAATMVPDNAFDAETEFTLTFLNTFKSSNFKVADVIEGQKVVLYYDQRNSQQVIDQLSLESNQFRHSEILDVVFSRYDVDNVKFFSYGIPSISGSKRPLRDSLTRLVSDEFETTSDTLRNEKSRCNNLGGVHPSVNKTASFGPLLPRVRNGTVVDTTDMPVTAVEKLAELYCDIFDMLFVPLQKLLALDQSQLNPQRLREVQTKIAAMQRKLLEMIDIIVKLKNGKPKPEVIAVDPTSRKMKLSKPARFIYSGTAVLPLAWLLSTFKVQSSPRSVSIMGYNFLTDGGLTKLIHGWSQQVEQDRSVVAYCMADNLYLLFPTGKRVKPLLLDGATSTMDFILMSLDARNQESAQRQACRNSIIRWFLDKNRSAAQIFADEQKVSLDDVWSVDFANFLTSFMSNTMPFNAAIGAQFEISHMMASGDRDTSIANDGLMGTLATLINLSYLNPGLPVMDTVNGGIWDDSLDELQQHSTGKLHMPSIFMEMAECLGIILKPARVIGTKEKGFLEMCRDPEVIIPMDLLGFSAKPLLHINDEVHLAPVLDVARLAGAMAYAKPNLRNLETTNELVKKMNAFANLAKSFSLLLCGAWVYPGFLQVLMSMQSLALAELIGGTISMDDSAEVLDATLDALAEAGLGGMDSELVRERILRQLIGLIPVDVTSILELIIPRKMFDVLNDTTKTMSSYYETYIPTPRNVDSQVIEQLRMIYKQIDTERSLPLRRADTDLETYRQLKRPRAITDAGTEAAVAVVNKLADTTIVVRWPITRIPSSSKQMMIVAWKTYYYTHLLREAVESKTTLPYTIDDWFEARRRLARHPKFDIRYEFDRESIVEAIRMYVKLSTRGRAEELRRSKLVGIRNRMGYIIQKVQPRIARVSKQGYKENIVRVRDEEVEDVDEVADLPDYEADVVVRTYYNDLPTQTKQAIVVPKPVNLPSIQSETKEEVKIDEEPKVPRGWNIPVVEKRTENYEEVGVTEFGMDMGQEFVNDDATVSNIEEDFW